MVSLPKLYPFYIRAIKNDNYSYVIIIPFISLFLLCQQGLDYFENHSGKHPASWVGVVIGLGIIYLSGITQRFPAFEMQFVSLGYIISFVSIYACFFDTPSIKQNWFSLVFLLFMLPLPDAYLEAIAQRLAEYSADLVNLIFHGLNVPFVREGQTIFQFSTGSYEVANQCSGIRSTSVLVILCAIFSHLYIPGWWRKFIFLFLIFPVAIIKNAIRIATLILLGTYVDRRFIEGQLHRNGGVVFFLMGLVIMFGIYKIVLGIGPKIKDSNR